MELSRKLVQVHLNIRVLHPIGKRSAVIEQRLFGADLKIGRR
jgi:hypothetical protein